MLNDVKQYECVSQNADHQRV